jgi:hypothetical protein
MLPWYRSEARRGRKLALSTYIPGIFELCFFIARPKKSPVTRIPVLVALAETERSEQRAGRGQSLAKIAEHKELDAICADFDRSAAGSKYFKVLGTGLDFILWAYSGYSNRFLEAEKLGRAFAASMI